MLCNVCWASLMLLLAFSVSISQAESYFNKYGDTDTSSFLLTQKECKCQTIAMNKIVGGQFSTNHIPWQVSLQYRGHICGATIINRVQILTAAHCVKKIDATKLSVVVGVNELTEYILNRNKARVLSCEYTDEILKNSGDLADQRDMAICTLNKHLDFSNKYIAPACFDKNFHHYNEMMASGWGVTTSSYNMYGHSITGSPTTRLKQAYFRYDRSLDACRTHLVCLSPEHQGDSICHGDSGGPLHASFESENKHGVAVIGVAGFVTGEAIYSGINRFCNGPSFYHRISDYTSFINKHVQKRAICWVDANPIDEIEELT